MMKIGTTEMLVILAIFLLIFGPSRLPALGKILGQTIGALRHYSNSANWDEILEEDGRGKTVKAEPEKKEEEAEPEGEQEEKAC